MKQNNFKQFLLIAEENQKNINELEIKLQTIKNYNLVIKVFLQGLTDGAMAQENIYIPDFEDNNN